MYQHQGASMTPFGSGYTMTYSSCDRTTLYGIRDFQRQVASMYPEWATRLDYAPGSCRLHVFPLSELPGAIFTSPPRDRYARRQ